MSIIQECPFTACPSKHATGDIVTFTAASDCTAFGVKFRKGDTVRLMLSRQWREEHGSWNGGPGALLVMR